MAHAIFAAAINNLAAAFDFLEIVRIWLSVNRDFRIASSVGTFCQKSPVFAGPVLREGYNPTGYLRSAFKGILMNTATDTIGGVGLVRLSIVYTWPV